MNPATQIEASDDSLAPGQAALVDEAIQAGLGLAGALLPILHGIQQRLGWVPAAALPRVAHALNLSRAEVHGVVSFYHYFRRRPPGRHVIHLCRAEACQAVGARALEDHVCRRLQTDLGSTSPDGRFTLEPVYCLGNCAAGPSLLMDEQLHACVTAKSFDALLATESA